MDLVDRRQRLAACILLSAIDLPANATDAAKTFMAAARVCPGVTVGEAHLGHRRDGLERAAALIAELLAEMPADG
jgi:hypothetical protein